jgi:hypothetical protein
MADSLRESAVDQLAGMPGVSSDLIPDVAAAVLAPWSPWPPAPFWEGVAVVAALAAAGLPEISGGVQFVAAGLLAASAAGTAWGEALLRRRGRFSDIGGLITMVLLVSSIMACMLGVAARSSH